MKVTTIIPEKVKLSELKCGAPFSYKLKPANGSLMFEPVNT